MAETVTMPKLGFDMAEGTLVRWVKQEGEAVKKGDILAEIETDKATLEVDSSYEGILARHLVEDGSVVPVGSGIALIAAPGEKIEETAKPSSEELGEQAAEILTEKTTPPAAAVEQHVETAQPQRTESGRVLASPLAKSIAREKGLDLESISGSGPGGRIIKRDVESAAATEARVIQVAATPAEVAPTVSYAVVQGADQEVPMSRLRAAIGRRMTESKQTIPHFPVTRSVDVEKLLALRKEINSQLPEGEKISVNDFIVKAAALALRQYPNLNASLGRNALILHGHVNIGIAVSVEGGLLTVVVRDTDVKSLRQIAGESAAMVSRARQGKVKPEDIEGSTFSVSNLGMYEVDEFAAIINPPEAAILAVGAAKAQPVVKDGAIEVGTRMNLTLSVDHRISDGVEAAQFMAALAALVENPWRLVL
ncbi:MAG: dihydrolipoamide acetyltransferase family protein [Anaerolineaceae bacterium]